MFHNIFSLDLILDRIIFLDGPTRAGKFLLGKIVSNFMGVEFFQYSAAVEHLPVFARLSIMSEKDAISYFRLQINMGVYERAIGRNLNTRINDSSCIKNSSEKGLYFERAHSQDGPSVLDKLRIEQRIPSFIIHQGMADIDFYLKACPMLNMINMRRHPVDLAYSWIKKGFGIRYGKDPLVFEPLFLNKFNNPVPWFALDFDDDFTKMSAEDKCIKSIFSIYKADKAAYMRLNAADKKQILYLCYENFFSRPASVINTISKFIKREPRENMDEILLREKCNAPIKIELRKEKFKKLSLNASPQVLDELIEIAKEYESEWHQASFL
ncbi:MAG: sulfotransferase domain-containing protein [Candidatus Omnitrophota bacterium]